jgi:acetyl-CoA synthetase
VTDIVNTNCYELSPLPGSTGQPKGLVHTTGGYALYAAFTAKTSFALEEGDLFACVADCGWITGHSYVVYGPLLNGSTTFVFESTPVYPDPGRYWDMIQRHKITQFYTAPTAIRLLMRYGVGKSVCSVVDTYWQTETGGHVLTNLPGVTPMKPGSCTLGVLGIDAVVLDPMSGHLSEELDEHGNIKGVLAIRQPWPGMARTCLGDHERFMKTYLNVYNGYYFTGDSVVRDPDGFHFVIGRVDDVINVSGHRIGTAEVESALVLHDAVAQAAVVGKPHDIKGQAIAAFVMLVEGRLETPELLKELGDYVCRDIVSGYILSLISSRIS